MEPTYIDDYGTCRRTWAGFRVFADDLDPDAVTDALGFTPDKAWRTGDPKPAPHLPPFARIGMWSFSSEGRVDSRDLRRHLDWVADRLDGKSPELQRFSDRGWKYDVTCFWEAANAGGPTLSPHQMARFSALGIDVAINFAPNPDLCDEA